MIKVFGQTDTSYTSNGDVVIQPLKAKIHKEDNGDYYLDLECSIEYLEWITQGRIVVVDSPTPGQQPQAFRIGNVTKTGKKLSTRAWHVYYDSKYYYSAGNGAGVQRTCEEFLEIANTYVKRTSPFTVDSDISGQSSINLLSNTYLYDMFQGIAADFGGHLVRDNFRVEVNSSIGTDNGLVIRYGSNLKEISCVENWDDVCTLIFPVGKDETVLTDSGGGTWEDNLLRSPVQYNDLPYFKKVNFSQTIKRSSYPSQAAYKAALVADLQAKAYAYMNEHALPAVSYTMKAHIDKITDVGDTIEVIDERLGIDLMTNVTSFDYDAISERFTEVVFGNYRNSAKGMGISMNKLLNNNRHAIIGNKELIFNSDESVSWIDTV